MPHDLPELEIAELKAANSTIRTAYRFRQGRGPCLVLVHGLGCSQRSFTKVWEFEAFRDRSVLALDLPGFGDSRHRRDRLGPLPGAGFSHSMEHHAEIVLAALAFLNVEECVLLGHSMGGVVVVLAARKMAQEGSPTCSGVVSVEGNLTAADCGVSKLAAAMSLRKFEDSLFPRLQDRTAPMDRAFTAMEMTTPYAFHESSRSLVRWSESGRLAKMFRSLPCAKLYIYGRRNHGQVPLALLEGVERHSVPDSGHFPMNENPPAFYTILSEWLDRLKRGAGT